MEIPTGLDEFVSDYQIKVFEVAWLSEEQIRRFRSDFRIVANFFVNKRKNKNYIPDDPTEIQHVDEVLKLLQVMTGDARYKRIFGKKKEGVHSMCDVAERLEKMGWEKGQSFKGHHLAGARGRRGKVYLLHGAAGSRRGTGGAVQKTRPQHCDLLCDRGIHLADQRPDFVLLLVGGANGRGLETLYPSGCEAGGGAVHRLWEKAALSGVDWFPGDGRCGRPGLAVHRQCDHHRGSGAGRYLWFGDDDHQGPEQFVRGGPSAEFGPVPARTENLPVPLRGRMGA